MEFLYTLDITGYLILIPTSWILPPPALPSKTEHCLSPFRPAFRFAYRLCIRLVSSLEGFRISPVYYSVLRPLRFSF